MGMFDRRSKDDDRHIIELIDQHATAFDSVDDAPLGPLLERIGDARVVLLGEATHGTSEFYAMRDRITRALVEQKGFDIVAVEADWPDAASYDRYVRGVDLESSDKPFRRFPQWMWRNRETFDLLSWLRGHNAQIDDPTERVGFFGLDVYSLYRSIAAVLRYLGEVDDEAAELARRRYDCFEGFDDEPQAYGAATVRGLIDSCEEDAVAMLSDLLDQRLRSVDDGNRHINAIQNARVVANAERYYRSMFHGRVSSWNLRDQHMFDTLEMLLDTRKGTGKAVVWEHNSHVGDARATRMGKRGEHNVGQLVREEYGDESYIIGFGTDRGTVAAARNWGDQMEIRDVTPSRPDSWESIFHRAEAKNLLLPVGRRGAEEVSQALRPDRLERAIGVIYRPETERMSHYFEASLSGQFDEYCWFDESTAVEAFTVDVEVDHDAFPDLAPFGV